jgi:protein-disulfide isomerase
MLASPVRGGLFALALFALAAQPLCAAEQTAGDAKLDPAVQAYIEKTKAEKEAAQEALIVANRSRLMGEPGTQTFGNPRGDVTIVEFFDYQCGYCKADEPLLESVMKQDPGIKLAIKEFPILGPMSLVAAKAALAVAAQGKYLAFHQALLAYKGRLDQGVIDDTAKSVGADVERMRKDMSDPATLVTMDDDFINAFNLARALRFFQTPVFIVGDKWLDSPRTEADFKNAVAEARAAAKKS